MLPKHLTANILNVCVGDTLCFEFWQRHYLFMLQTSVWSFPSTALSEGSKNSPGLMHVDFLWLSLNDFFIWLWFYALWRHACLTAFKSAADFCLFGLRMTQRAQSFVWNCTCYHVNLSFIVTRKRRSHLEKMFNKLFPHSMFWASSSLCLQLLLNHDDHDDLLEIWCLKLETKSQL